MMIKLKILLKKTFKDVESIEDLKNIFLEKFIADN